MSLQNKIAIITDDPGWHGRQLKEVFATRGFDSDYLSLMDCYFDLNGKKPDIILPGFDMETLAGVFVRGVPGGTLEQIILRLNILHALYDCGKVVYNTGRGVEKTVDKAMTSFLLKHKGIPTPDTWICESIMQACAIIERYARKTRPLVMKPLFGSQGNGVVKIESLHDLPGDMEEYGDVYYLQKYAGKNYAGQNKKNSRGELNKDWRVFVINGRAEAMMVRISENWVTNRAQGAQCIAIRHDHALANLAEAAVRAVGIDYAGVDLIQDEKGNFMVIEVNSVPAWQGLQRVCEFKVADRLVDHFLSKVASSQKIKVIK